MLAPLTIPERCRITSWGSQDSLVFPLITGVMFDAWLAQWPSTVVSALPRR